MILSLYSHYINLAGIPFVPQRWEHFQFLESQREIEAVGVVVNSISAHLDGFDLDKGISQPFGFGFGFGGNYQQQRGPGYNGADTPEMQASRNFIVNQRYPEARRVLDGMTAHEKKVGGELLCEIW